MKLWVYTFCWNEEKIIPYFLRHYGEWLCAEKIVIFDNESTDNSLGEINRWGHLDIEVRPYSTADMHSELGAMKPLRDECWQEARGKADWVAIVDMDEFIFHNDIFGFLDRCESRGIGLVRTYGFEMVSREFPQGRRQKPPLGTCPYRRPVWGLLQASSLPTRPDRRHRLLGGCPRLPGSWHGTLPAVRCPAPAALQAARLGLLLAAHPAAQGAE